jgi:hypothetical protein
MACMGGTNKMSHFVLKVPLSSCKLTDAYFVNAAATSRRQNHLYAGGRKRTHLRGGTSSLTLRNYAKRKWNIFLNIPSLILKCTSGNIFSYIKPSANIGHIFSLLSKF